MIRRERLLTSSLCNISGFSPYSDETAPWTGGTANPRRCHLLPIYVKLLTASASLSNRSKTVESFVMMSKS
jgi:hypothetical protein